MAQKQSGKSAKPPEKKPPTKRKAAEPTPTQPKSLQDQANEILERAEQKGVETNFFFRQTFESYKTKLEMLAGLAKEIEGNGLMIRKEYVKGRPCLVANPAINEYNKTSNSANSDVTTMIRIIEAFAETGEAESNPLADIMKLITGG